MNPIIQKNSFTSDAEGWTVITYPGKANVREAVWSTGKISYTPTPQETDYYFNAPAGYTVLQERLFGKTLSCELAFGSAPSRLEAVPAIIIVGTTKQLAYVLPEGTESINGTISLSTRIDATGVWKLLPENTLASDEDIKAVLKDVQHILIYGSLPNQPQIDVSLSNVTLAGANPGLLTTTVRAYYQNGHLFAECDTIEGATAYTIIVKDDANKEVLALTWRSAAFVPPVQLSGPDFTPILGKSYTVTAVISGPESDALPIVPIEITETMLSVLVDEEGANFSWEPIDTATLYELFIAKAGAPTVAVYSNERLTTSPILVKENEGLEMMVSYIARIRGRAGLSYGPWSADLSFEISPAKRILKALKSRLESNKPTETTIGLNSTTLPEGKGNPAAILQLIKDCLTVDALTIAYTSLPALSDDGLSLTVIGKADWNGTATELNISFEVSAQQELTLMMTMELPESWKFADSFIGMDFSELNYLLIQHKELILTSFEHAEANRFKGLIRGLNFFGDYTFPEDFKLDKPANTYNSVKIGGSIIRTTDSTEIKLIGEAKIPDVHIELTGLPALVFTEGILSVSSLPVVDDWNTDAVVWDGYVAQFDDRIAYQLSAPTSTGSELQLRRKDNAKAYALPTLLSGTAGNVLEGLLPTSLLQLAQLKIRELEYCNINAYNRSTEVSMIVQPEERDVYELLPSLVALSDVKFGLNVIHTRTGETLSATFSTSVSGRFTFGGLPVEVSLFVPIQQDWVLCLRPIDQATASLSNVEAFTGEDQATILAIMPSFFKQLTGFEVEEIRIGAAVIPPSDRVGDFSPHLSFIDFNLKQPTPWNIVDDVLQLADWTLKTKLVKQTDGWDTSGVLAGKLNLGKNTASFEIEMMVPIGELGWRIGLAEEGFDLPGIGEILRIIGADRVTDMLPKGIQSFGKAHISVFEVYFDPTASPIVKRVSFQMNTTEPWKIIENKGLEITDIEAGLTLVNGSSESYTLGFIQGTLTIAGTAFSVNAGRTAKDAPWIFQTTTIDTVHLPGLNDLTAWMLPDTLVRYIPTNLMPFAQGVDITAAGFEFDLSKNILNHVSFSIANREKWNLVTGFVSIDEAVLTAQIDHPLEEKPGLTLLASALLEIATLDIAIKAEKNAPEADWIFTGELAKRAVFNFDDALCSLSMKLSLAYNLGFPREIVLETAKATANATKGGFEIAMTSTFDWHVGFGVASLSIKSLNVDLKIDAIPEAPEAGQSSERKYRSSVKGGLAIGNLHTDILYVTGNNSADKTILTATVTPAELEKVTIDSFVDTLTVTDTKGEKWETTKPTAYTTPVFEAAYLHLNLSDNIGFLFGSVSHFAEAAVMIKKIDTDNWGYAFGLNLGEDFRFGSILPALAIIDTYLHIKSAGLFVVSYEESATSLAQDLQQITNFPDKPKEYTNAVTISGLGDIKLSKGMLLYGHLDINTSPLFNRLLEIGTNGAASVVISAIIDKADSIRSTFVAELPDITVLSTIVFTHTDAYTGIRVQYAPQNKNEFTLVARLKIDAIFGKNYAFDGALTINEDRLDANLTLMTGAVDNEIVRPFGIPGLIVRELKAGVTYIFANATGTVPHTTSLFTISGKVKIGTPPAIDTPDSRADLDIALCLAGANPTLARVSLIEDLPVGAFFAQFLTGDGTNWPSNFFEITFKSGSEIYYYDKEKDTNSRFLNDKNQEARKYLDGFNIQADIILRILVDIPIHFNLHANKDANGKFNGVIASGSILAGPIDLYVLQIASEELGSEKYVGPPKFTLDTTKRSNAVMGFVAGFNFFQKPFGKLGLTMQRVEGTEELQLQGRLESAQVFEVFGALSLDFSYSESQGFNINNWPAFDFLREAVDFVKTLQKIAEAGTGPCGKLMDFIIENVYQTKFTITPTFKTENGGLYFVLNGTYALSSMGHEFLSAKFPKGIPFRLPEDLSLDALPGEIFKSLTGAAKLFVESLLDNPDAIAKFLVIVGGKKAAQYAADLVCQGLVDATVAGAAEAGTVALAEAGGMAAGAAAIAAASTVIAAAVKDATGRPSEVTNPEPPSGIELLHSNGVLTATWKAASFASGYEVVFFNDKNERLKSETIKYIRSVSLTIEPDTRNMGYTVKVASLRGDYKSSYSEHTISRWETPANVALTPLNDTRKLHVDWIGNAPKYEVCLYLQDTFISKSTFGQSPATLDTGTLIAGGYHVVVYAKSDDASKIPSLVSPNSNLIIILENPSDIGINYLPDTNEIAVTGKGGNSPAGFEIKVLDEAGIVLTETNTAVATEGRLSYTFGLNNLVVKSGSYHAAVTAQGDQSHLKSLTVSSSDRLTKAGLVEGVTLIADDDSANIIANWDGIDNVHLYTLQLFGQDKTVPLKVYAVDKVAAEGKINYPIDIKPFSTPTAMAFTAKVGVKGDSKTISGDLTTSSNLIHQLAAPTAIVARWSEDDEKITITWTNAAAATALLLNLKDLETDGVLLERILTSTDTQFEIAVSDIPSSLNGNYQVTITAKGIENVLNSIPGLSNELQVIHLPIPSLPTLAVENGNTLNASVQGLAKLAEGNEAQLIVDEATTGEIQKMVLSADETPTYRISFTLDEGLPGNRFAVHTRSVRAGVKPSSWVKSSDTLTRLGQVHTQPLAIVDDFLIVKLAVEVANAAKYEAVLLVNGVVEGNPVELIKEVGASEPCVNIKLKNELIGSELQIKARAIGDHHINSLWSTSEDSIVYKPIAPPQAPELVIDSPNLKVRWKEIPLQGSMYQIEISDGTNGQPLTPQPAIDVSQNEGRIALAALDYNKSYKARIRVLKNMRIQVLKNGDALEGFDHWDMVSNLGNKWEIEHGPGESCKVSEGSTNFVTSYDWDRKAQTVELLNQGFTVNQLDEMPKITVSDWICSRFDCQGAYEMTVRLLDRDRKVIAEYKSGLVDAPMPTKDGYSWMEVGHVFENYGEGLRFIHFEHAGKDKKRWRGHYGSKITGGRIYLDLKTDTQPGPWSDFSNVINTSPDPRVPTVVRIPATTKIDIPDGLKKVALLNPDTLDHNPNYPVIQWNSLTFWPLSFDSNDYRMAVVAYDNTGKIVSRKDYYGARYIYTIEIDKPSTQVTLIGQVNKKINIPWNDLFK